jgi:osmoprotectant transport system permease protein
MRADIAQQIFFLTWEHLQMVALAVGVAIVIAVPAGIWIAHNRTVRPWVTGFANIVQTVPSLALFGFLIPLPFIGGIGTRTAVVALVLYALLPVLRGTLAGIQSIDAGVRDSAQAMGMNAWQLLTIVELPLAARNILAGVRIATVSTIGTATIAAAIGAGGLGVFIFEGIASVDTTQILAGAIPAALLALIADGLLGLAERRIITW